MSTVSEILANINSRRVTAANPVISTAIATMIGRLSNTSGFDAEVDTEILFAPLPKRFVASAYTRMAWSIDILIKNDLRTAERMLDNNGFTWDANNRTESFNELHTRLDEMFESENNSFEAGFGDTGILHRIAAALNIRLAYHENAETKMRSQRKEYTFMTICTQIGNPNKQVITKNELANLRMNALRAGFIESDIPARNQFDHGVIWTNEMAAKAKVIANLESRGIKAPLPEAKKATHTKEQIELMECDDRLHALATSLGNLPGPVIQSLTAYRKFIDDREAKLNEYYESELSKIPVMNYIHDFCTRKVPDDKLAFAELPRAIQIHLLDHLDASLTQTMKSMTTVEPSLYNDYMAACTQLHEYFAQAINERFEDNESGATFVEPELTEEEKEAVVERSTNRRRSHKKLEAGE